MKNVKEESKRLLEKLDKASTFASSQSDEVTKSNLNTFIKSLKRKALKIDKAIENRPSIAIFGQSQVGKSYLVQNLVKKSDAIFLKINGGENNHVNFLTEMNPDGGQESTGLVTRFTTEKIVCNNEFPFLIKLFSQLDVASILINSFWFDLKDYGSLLSRKDYEFTLNLLEKHNDEIKENELCDYKVFYFIQYLKEKFSDSFVFRELDRLGYFKKLHSYLLSSNYDDRWEVLEILWGKNKFITELFKKISGAIKKLQFSSKAHVQLNALTPNTSSIIDVERVREMFDSKVELSVLVEGEEIKINRSLLSILTKEVCLELSDDFEESDSRSFINSSDLLDFPGSKSREKIPLSVFNKNTTTHKLQLLIRGKVDFLFDSYSNSFGVDTLLYCMDDSPPEEKEAPARLYNWVSKYVGASLTERTKTIQETLKILNKDKTEVKFVSPLLIALTKFNQEINQVIPGKESNIEVHDSKWQARINENFINYMMRPVEDKWILNWTDMNHNFNFLFPIRDPMYSQATYEGYETEGKETAIRPERKEAMKAIGLSFQGSSYSRNHIINADEVWDEISTPNGSGINYLAQNLKNSANPLVASTRIVMELCNIKNELKNILSPFMLSGNIEEDTAKAKKYSNNVFTGLISMANRKDVILPKLLSKFIISDSQIWNVIYENLFKSVSKQNSEGAIDNKINLIDSLNDIGVNFDVNASKESIFKQLELIYEGMSRNEIKETIQEFFDFDLDNIDLILDDSEKNNVHDLSQQIITYWYDFVSDILMNNPLLEKLQPNQKDAFNAAINQILKSKDRVNLKHKIDVLIEDVQSGNINQEDIDVVASSCSKLLNNFLFSASWQLQDEEKKPLNHKNNNPVFSEFARDFDINKLNYKQEDNNKIYFKEWLQACKENYVANVKFDYGVKDNIDNRKLLNDIL